MFSRKETSLTPTQAIRWRGVGRPVQPVSAAAGFAWSPGIDVFEKDNRLVTTVAKPAA